MAGKRKKNWAVKNLLSDWYGEERGTKEMLTYQPKTVEISEAIDKAFKRFMAPDDIKMLKIKSGWREIVGEQIANIAVPISIREGTIYIEVSHPLWLRELNGPAGEVLKSKINQVGGKRFCKNLRFVPMGSQKRD